MIEIIAVIGIIFAIALFISYILFLIIFYVPARKKMNLDIIDLQKGKIYEPYWENMRSWIRESRSMKHENFAIKSFDGLTLCGKFYEFAPNAPIELMFHGYRGNAERDLSGGVHRCFQLGHSALIVDQRCAGQSEGNVITFGINEHKDCLSWINFMIHQFGPDVSIILTGISMGATTVLLAAGEQLPKNVIGVLADCGFHSARDIICSVADSMHLPGRALYPFAKLGARIFGHFNIEEITAEEAVKNCQVPVLFFHGETDNYVPSYMSGINYTACASRKKLVLVPNAGHGLCYPVDPDTYISEMDHFFRDNGRI